MAKIETTQPAPSTYGEVERTGDEPLTWKLKPSNGFTAVRDVLVAIRAKETAKADQPTGQCVWRDRTERESGGHGIPDPVPDCAS